MVGVSDTGRAATYYYYACGKKYKYHTCDKRSERKDFLEQLVVELTLEYVLEPKRMDFIADRVMALYQNEFNEENVKAIECRVAALEEEIEKAVNAFIDADSKMVRAKLNQRVEDLEAQKNELLNDRDGLVAASKIPVSKAQFIAWLKTFERGNPADKDFQKRVVDALINSFYLYDDKFIIYFNIDGGEVVGYPQASEDVELAENFEENENTPTSTGGGNVRISKATLHQSKPKTNHSQVKVVLGFSFLVSPFYFLSVKKTLPIQNKELIQNGVKTQSLPHREYGRIAKRFSGERPFPCALSSALFRLFPMAGA